MKLKTLLALLLALCLCVSPLSVFAADGLEDGEDEEESSGPLSSATSELLGGLQELLEQATAQAQAEAEAQANGTYTFPELGEPMPDFSFTDINGTEHTLSETLQEKKLVMLNIWATWCGPCESEFPFMEQAYEQYKDDVEIFALSIEPEDTDEVLAAYADEHGMTFPIGHALPGMDSVYINDGIPGTFVIDRFGNMCLYESGAQTVPGTFERMFELFIGDDYTESTPMDSMPPVPPDMEFPPIEEAAAALLAEDAGDVTVRYPDDEYSWPMVAAEDDGRVCVGGSNAGEDKTYSSIELAFTAAEGDVLAVDYRVSCESYYDNAGILLDGEEAVFLTGERDWQTYAIALEPGEHTVTLRYSKDELESGGDDNAWFGNARLLSGDAAQQALDAVAVYPFSDATTVTVANEGAQEIVFTPPLADDGSVKGYIVPGGDAELSITLAEGSDPYTANIYRDYDGTYTVLANAADGDGYTTGSGVDSMAATGYAYSVVDVEAGDFFVELLLFTDEQNVNTFMDDYEMESWTYADGTEPGTDERASDDEGADGMSDYALSFVGPDGEPVEGVIANVCDDDTCEPMTSDADGMIEFTKPAFAYHIQIIKVPDGYSYDTSEESYLDEAGSAVTFTLDKAE